MISRRRLPRHALPSLSVGLLAVLALVLWVAGGASRADVMGQALVRGAAIAAVLLAALFSGRPHMGGLKPVLWLLLAAIALVLLQLVPLPPELWRSLPGRAPFAFVALKEASWRPLSIEPSATVNAAASLFVPLAVLVLMSGIRREERGWPVVALLGLIVAWALIGLTQLAGRPFDNPFVNDVAGSISSLFANRNHFALVLALGCLVAPVWALQGDAPWRMPVALGLVVLFVLIILASGSRAGLALGVVGTAIGLLLARRALRRALRRVPRWAQLGIGIAAVGTLVALVLISVVADRAHSIDRIMAMDEANDMRARALPTVMAMIRAYLPYGTGFGSFDTAFRMHEPFELLKPTYFNHAHDDFLEVVLDGGLAGLALLAAAVVWWIFASVAVWRGGSSSQVMLGRLGSGMILLILLASIVDYPARTPAIMAIVILAAAWLSWGANAAKRSALPKQNDYL